MERKLALLLSSAGILVTLGIVFGDIGNSSINEINLIKGENLTNCKLILVGTSCVFLTLTIIESFNYVYPALISDNNGES